MPIPYIVNFSSTEIEDTFDRVVNADTAPVNGSTFMIESGAVYAALQDKAPTADPTFTGTLTAAAIKGYRPTSTQTGTTYTFAIGDANTLVYANNASAQTYTVPTNASVAFAVGDEIELFNLGAGIVTIEPAVGVTIYSKGALLSMSDQYAAAILKKQASDTWILIGDLA